MLEYDAPPMTLYLGQKGYLRIPCGQEPFYGPALFPRYNQERCDNCGAPWGSLHKDGCIMEECPACPGKLRLPCTHWKALKPAPYLFPEDI
jgi:hypothetical protein